MMTQGKDADFEMMPVADLDQLLRKFYGDVRTKSAETYSKAAYVNLRAGINRHITSPPFNRPINIMRDRDFQMANNVFMGMLKRIRAEGKDTSAHKSPVSSDDMKKMYSSGILSSDSPKALQRKVFVELGLHFARRGREGLRELHKESFTFCTDTNGNEYIKMSYHEKEKNHQGTMPEKREKKKQAIMLAQPGDRNCPVASFKLYLSKLNPLINCLYQKPNPNWQSNTDSAWYLQEPLGKNRLGDMMKNISHEAKLSQAYTNHCLRVTTATVLSDAGFHISDIARVTGHSCTESLKSYIDKPSQNKQNALSRALHVYGKENMPDDVQQPMETPQEMPLVARPRPTPISNQIVGRSSSSPCTNVNQCLDIDIMSQMHASGLFTGARFNDCTFKVVIKK